MLIEIFAILALAALGWFWIDALATRELALQAGREACDAQGLQFLDDTVAVGSLRLARNDEGQLRFKRVYDFEYSDTGDNRRKGHLTLIGRELMMVYTGPSVVPSVLH